jgi:hypothetical protein
MKNENGFFAAIVVSKRFRDGVLNPQTRLQTAQGGYLDEDFGVEQVDKEIFEEIEIVENMTEFAQKYRKIKSSKQK